MDFKKGILLLSSISMFSLSGIAFVSTDHVPDNEFIYEMSTPPKTRKLNRNIFKFIEKQSAATAVVSDKEIKHGKEVEVINLLETKKEKNVVSGNFEIKTKNTITKKVRRAPAITGPIEPAKITKIEKIKIDEIKPLKKSIDIDKLVTANLSVTIQDNKIVTSQLNVPIFNKIKDYGQINSNELVSHKGFKVNTKSKINLLALVKNIEYPKEEKTLMAEVKIKNEKVEKIKPSIIREEKNEIANVENVNPFTAKADNDVISNSVLKAIKRATKKVSVMKVGEVTKKVASKINNERPVINTRNFTVDIEQSPKVAYVKQPTVRKNSASVNQLKKEIDAVQDAVQRLYSSNDKKEDSDIVRSTIIVGDASLIKGNISELNGVQFTPDYDQSKIIYDEQGKIVFEERLKNDYSIIRGVVDSREHIRTHLNIGLDKNHDDEIIYLPMVKESELADLLERDSLAGVGGFLLIELSDEVENVDIDAKEIEAQYFLNDKFAVVTDEKDYKYVLYIGVTPGNVLTTYKLGENKFATKINHIVDEELVFDSPVIFKTEKQRITLTEKGLLSKINKEVSIDPSNIAYFDQKMKVTKIGPNAYEFNRPLIASGIREYLEIKYLDIDSVFVGMWNINKDKKIELPGVDFIGHVLDTFNVDELTNMCLVQFNFKNKIENIQISGRNSYKDMLFEKLYLDKNGEFIEEVTSTTEKMILLGDEQGIINLKVEYIDGKVDYIKSICSKDSYIVEEV